MCRLSGNLGASNSWSPEGLSKDCYSCHILKKLDFSGQRFSKNTEISNFVKIFPADEQTDRYDETNSRFSPLCEGAQNGKKLHMLKISGSWFCNQYALLS
jgi:hypothetical protein